MRGSRRRGVLRSEKLIADQAEILLMVIYLYAQEVQAHVIDVLRTKDLIMRDFRVISVKVPETLFREVRSFAGRADMTNAEVVAQALRLLFSHQGAANPNQVEVKG